MMKFETAFVKSAMLSDEEKERYYPTGYMEQMLAIDREIEFQVLRGLGVMFATEAWGHYRRSSLT